MSTVDYSRRKPFEVVSVPKYFDKGVDGVILAQVSIFNDKVGITWVYSTQSFSGQIGPIVDSSFRVLLNVCILCPCFNWPPAMLSASYLSG